MSEKLICFHCKGEIDPTKPYRKIKSTLHKNGKTISTIKKQYHENCKIEVGDLK